MPIMETNEKLMRIIRGRSIELVSQEEGLVTIVFDDYSTMRVKVAGGPTMNRLGEGKIESVGGGRTGTNPGWRGQQYGNPTTCRAWVVRNGQG
jgi:hypothetical protein